MTTFNVLFTFFLFARRIGNPSQFKLVILNILYKFYSTIIKSAK